MQIAKAFFFYYDVRSILIIIILVYTGGNIAMKHKLSLLILAACAAGSLHAASAGAGRGQGGASAVRPSVSLQVLKRRGDFPPPRGKNAYEEGWSDHSSQLVMCILKNACEGYELFSGSFKYDPEPYSYATKGSGRFYRNADVNTSFERLRSPGGFSQGRHDKAELTDHQMKQLIVQLLETEFRRNEDGSLVFPDHVKGAWLQMLAKFPQDSRIKCLEEIQEHLVTSDRNLKASGAVYKQMLHELVAAGRKSVEPID